MVCRVVQVQWFGVFLGVQNRHGTWTGLDVLNKAGPNRMSLDIMSVVSAMSVVATSVHNICAQAVSSLPPCPSKLKVTLDVETPVVPGRDVERAHKSIRGNC